MLLLILLLAFYDTLMNMNHLGVEPKIGVFFTPPPQKKKKKKSSILIGFGTIIHHPFWGTPIFWKHPFRPFGRGPTTPVRGLTITMVIKWDDPPSGRYPKLGL